MHTPPLPLGKISGRSLRALALAMQAPVLRTLAARAVRKQLGIDLLRSLPADSRGPLLPSQSPLRARANHERPSAGLAAAKPRAWPPTALTYRRAFEQGDITPEELARAALAAARDLAAQVPSLGPLCGYDDDEAREHARACTERLRSGGALSDLDGVPLVVKEELDVKGLPTRLGTGFMPYYPAARDALPVERLRRRGMVVLGQTPMTEYGMSPLGVNVHRRMPRNAHDPARLAGGSSTGSAVAVALGVAPIALGTDGGGSIRIPAAYNGVFGVKPTYGRVPLIGHGSPGTTSVVHVGAIAGSVSDLAAALGALSGPAEGDDLSLLQPPLEPRTLVEALGRGVEGIAIGVDPDEWQADPEVARLGRAALESLESEGARLVPVQMRLAPHAAAIGYLTIALEIHAGLREIRREHFHDLGHDLQVMLAGLDTFLPDDYLDAQRLRSALRRELASILTEVDVIALPSTANTAPRIEDSEMTSGILDPPGLEAACRFAFLANLTGLPAATAPVGLAEDGLPVGLQIIGDAWDEACVIQVLAHLERTGAAHVSKPANAVDLLG